MAKKIDIAKTNISASQMSEFFRLAALPGSHVNRKTFQEYLEFRNPFTFELNEHGHVIISIIGFGLTGVQNVELLESDGYTMSNEVKFCLKSTAKDSYDRNHRLVANQMYKIALVPGKEITDSERTTKNMRKLGMEKYGYGKPLAEFVLRILQAVSDKQMRKMGIYSITSLHDPIKDSGSNPRILIASLNNDNRYQNLIVYGGDRWGEYQAFAFPISESSN